MNKDIPEKVLNFKSKDAMKVTWTECPNCRKWIGGFWTQERCSHCGQKIIWHSEIINRIIREKQ